MDLSNFIKITPSKPKQPSSPQAAQSSSPQIKNSGSSLSQNQIIGIGILIFGVILIGIAILTWPV